MSARFLVILLHFSWPTFPTGFIQGIYNDINRLKMDTKSSVNVLYDISQLLNTGLDKKTLSLCVSLCEMGVAPEAIVVNINELNFF